MNLKPFPHPDDVIFTERYTVKLTPHDGPSTTYPVELWAATFQGNDRPSLTAYGKDVGEAVASLYNALYNVLTVEYDLEQEG